MAEIPVCQDCCQIVRVAEDGRVGVHSSGPYDGSACPSSGLLSGRLAEIVAATAPKAQLVRPSSARQPLAPPRPVPPILPDPHAMPAPRWVPQWKGASLAAVVLPASGRLGVWIPGLSGQMQAIRVGHLTQRNVTSLWSGHLECWTVNNQHFLAVANMLMRRYGIITVGREYNPSEKCTASCRRAEGPLCTCSCQARHHGGGQWMADWVVAGEFGSTVNGKPWHWLVASTA